ncbi:unnamed protein product [Miscanthus lutarioriparius]|uniref:Uncharacterized protein n=1 Tax=Miscanthus lutarioriparius TaxID=422564 RepID=A0A811PT54_9POAL|nr:unnamed protein product [Miscanthus lutarioriparius]
MADEEEEAAAHPRRRIHPRCWCRGKLPLGRPQPSHAAVPSSISGSHAAAPASGREGGKRQREGQRPETEVRRVAAALESREDWGFGSREMKTCLVAVKASPRLTPYSLKRKAVVSRHASPYRLENIDLHTQAWLFTARKRNCTDNLAYFCPL